jgi:hypothetical protein
VTTIRRLAAILAADVAGYSRLMGADEDGTHERLKALRRELAEARRLAVDGRFSSIVRLKAFHGPWWGAPKVRALYEATYFAGLRKAGMPEE